MIIFLKKLLSKKSISPKDMGCQNLISNKLKKIGFNCYKLDKKNTSNLWATYGRNNPIFCFGSHTDIVSSGDISLWKYHPFKGIIKNGVIYGRGISNMKGALVAQIFAVEKFIKKYKKIPGSITFLTTSDEEGDGYNGMNIAIKILNEKGIKIDNIIIGKPSCKNNIGDNIKIGRRGSINVKITFYGKQGHIAHNKNTANPINLAIPIINKINNIIWNKINKEFPITNLQFFSINVGNKTCNIVPSKLEVNFNIRYSPFYNINYIRNKIINYTKLFPHKFIISFNLSAKPFITDINSKLIGIICKSIYMVNKNIPKYSTDGGISDSRFLYKYIDNVIELGLINKSIHKSNEYSLVKDLYILYQIYYKILKKFFINKEN